MGSYKFDGVTFRVYPEDHEPVHGRYQGVLVIVELGGRTIRIAERWDAIRPGDAKKNQVRHILQVASVHYDDLMELWR